MKNSINVSTGKAAVLLLLIAAALTLFGCTMVGKVVPEQNRILFNDKATDQGTYSDDQLNLDYSYQLDGRKLTLEGQINSQLAVDSVDVSLLFFDASGTVLQDTIVYYSGYRESSSSSADATFKAMLVVPRGAVGISFSMTDMDREGRQI